MPPCHPTFEVLAFHAPVVERGVLRQVIHTDTGLRQFVAPVEVWQAALAAIGDAILTQLQAPAEPKAAATRAPRGRSTIADCYHQALADFEAGRFPTRRAAAVAHGLSAAGFYVWLNRQKKLGRLA